MNNDSKDGLIFGLSTAVVVLLGVVFCVGIGLLIFGLNNWGKVQNAKVQGTLNNIQSHNYVKNYGYQLAERQAVTADKNQINQYGVEMAAQGADRTALGDARINMVMTLCDDASKVDPSQGPLPDAAFVTANCQGSTINPASPYEAHPTAINP